MQHIRIISTVVLDVNEQLFISLKYHEFMGGASCEEIANAWIH